MTTQCTFLEPTRRKLTVNRTESYRKMQEENDSNGVLSIGHFQRHQDGLISPKEYKLAPQRKHVSFCDQPKVFIFKPNEKIILNVPSQEKMLSEANIPSSASLKSSLKVKQNLKRKNFCYERKV